MLLWTTLALAASFPPLEIYTLDDRRVQLPADIGNTRVAILVEWSRQQDDDLRAWTSYLLRFDKPYWSLPLVGNLGSVFDSAVLVGMRASLDAERELRTAPVFKEPPDLKPLLGSDAKNVDVYVVSGDGKIHLHEVGPFADDKAQRVVAAIK